MEGPEPPRQARLGGERVGQQSSPKSGFPIIRGAPGLKMGRNWGSACNPKNPEIKFLHTHCQASPVYSSLETELGENTGGTDRR